MAFSCGSNIYISLHVSGQYILLYICQHLSAADSLGNTLINTDGLYITMDKISSLLFQLNAINALFAKGHETSSTKNVRHHMMLHHKLRRSPIKKNTADVKLFKNQDVIKLWSFWNAWKEAARRFSLIRLMESQICNTPIDDTSHKFRNFKTFDHLQRINRSPLWLKRNDGGSWWKTSFKEELNRWKRSK